jgi:hypothetical protein
MATRPPRNKTGGFKAPSNKPAPQFGTGAPRPSGGLGQLPSSFVQDPITGKWRNTLTDEQQRERGNNVPSAPPAATPAPPPPAPTDYLFPDEAYTQEIAGYGNSRNNIFAAIAAQRIATGEQYGVDVNSGLIKDNVDVTNPYSRAAMMNRAYASNKAGNMNSYANRGLLTSGAYARRIEAAAQTNNQNRQGLENDWTNARLGWLSQENNADADLARSKVAAQRALMERRMTQEAATFAREDAPAADPTPPPDYSQIFADLLRGLAASTQAAAPATTKKPTTKNTKKPTTKNTKKPTTKKPAGKKGKK